MLTASKNRIRAVVPNGGNVLTGAVMAGIGSGWLTRNALIYRAKAEEPEFVLLVALGPKSGVLSLITPSCDSFRLSIDKLLLELWEVGVSVPCFALLRLFVPVLLLLLLEYFCHQCFTTNDSITAVMTA